MTFIIQVRDYAVAFRLGLSFGRMVGPPVEEEPPSAPKGPVGFTPNEVI